jgi:hypothetical protein
MYAAYEKSREEAFPAPDQWEQAAIALSRKSAEDGSTTLRNVNEMMDLLRGAEAERAAARSPVEPEPEPQMAFDVNDWDADVFRAVSLAAMGRAYDPPTSMSAKEFRALLKSQGLAR